MTDNTIPNKPDSHDSLAHIQRERDTLEAILETANDAVIMLNTEQRVVTANLQFESYFGIPRYSVIGEQVEELATRLGQNPALPSELSGIFLRLASEPSQTLGGDSELATPERRTLVWYSAPVHGQTGALLGRLFVFRDTTRERDADRMKTQFVSMISHELRTPLTSIKGFTDLMLEGEAGELLPGVREYLDIIKFSANRLLHLVNDILDVTQLEAGRLELRPTRLNVSALIEAAIAPFGPIALGKGQLLALELPTPLPDAWADPERVTQILTNLISNALKYTPDGGTIRVRARIMMLFDTLPPNAPPEMRLPALLVAICDSGSGIESAQQAELFTRFYRTAQAINSQEAGTGLGLFIVKSLVTLQGGVVWVYSEPGRGSDFYFTLPLADG
ncbi:MAG: sensor histidine kinase [Aggregatilineales bacterium]